MLTVIDEFTRRCMAVVVERRLNSDNVLHCLTELFVQHGPPDHIRSDNGSEFTAHAVRDWLGRIGVKTLYIEPGSPWENGYNESFNSKLRDEILNTEIFYTLKEAKVLIERWRHHYNTIRCPHSSLLMGVIRFPRARPAGPVDGERKPWNLPANVDGDPSLKEPTLDIDGLTAGGQDGDVRPFGAAEVAAMSAATSPGARVGPSVRPGVLPVPRSNEIPAAGHR